MLNSFPPTFLIAPKAEASRQQPRSSLEKVQPSTYIGAARLQLPGLSRHHLSSIYDEIYSTFRFGRLCPLQHRHTRHIRVKKLENVHVHDAGQLRYNDARQPPRDGALLFRMLKSRLLSISEWDCSESISDLPQCRYFARPRCWLF
jgi:hypothetical protein